MLIQIEHANVTVASISAAKDFLKVAFPDFAERGGGLLHDGVGRWIHFGNNDTYIALQQNSKHDGRQDRPYVNDGINHLGYVVSDLSDLIQRMSRAGFEPTQVSTRDDHPWRLRAYFVDGNEMEWEFIEYLSTNKAEQNDYPDQGD